MATNVEGVPRNYFKPALGTSIVVPGHIVVYSFSAFNTNAATRYMQVFDNSGLPANGAVPIMVVPLATNASQFVNFTTLGREFIEGFVIATSTAVGSLTLGAADALFDVQYDIASV